MAVPPGLAKPHRILALVPVVFAFLVVLSGVAIAFGHLAVKGGAPQSTPPQGPMTQQQIATGQTPHPRGPYNLKDVTEPDLR